MKVLLAIDHHFFRTPDGEVFLGPPMSIPGYRFWERYLAVFEDVLVLGRVKTVSWVNPGALPAGGPGVAFHDLPDYLGPWQYAKALGTLKREVEKAVDQCDAYILRVPGAIGQLAWRSIRKRGLPFAVEVVADPWDILSPGATRSVVRPVVRRMWLNQLRQMCSDASAVCYVTRQALQRRYPPGPSTWARYVSDVELSEGVASQTQIQARFARLANHLSENGSGSHPLRVGFLGSLAQIYKAPDILLQAAAICYRNGLDFEVMIAGDGKFRGLLEKVASDLGITNRVLFLGALTPGKDVFVFLDQIDLFVLPSRVEGLPRAMVEAMSRACPCIGSTVGGIPELLPTEDLVEAGDANGLATKIQEVLASRERMRSMSERNLKAAQDYLPAILQEKRLGFYKAVREQAELARRRPA